MTLAAAPSKPSRSLSSPGRASHGQRIFAAWQLLPAAFAMLVGFLVFTPDGAAEPLQAFAGWLLVGLMAAFAVIAVAKGLERLLECDGDCD